MLYLHNISHPNLMNFQLKFLLIIQNHYHDVITHLNYFIGLNFVIRYLHKPIYQIKFYC
jgi:hypothetical protein